ncbi:hypothetical protein HCU74_08440 [Spongiibacter sp. KMU-166]|uniref:Tip attachment protein J domain-containing protein n=1 Tax=Spongiibacter thalassae TaxID=2721624 RepID=A0ABX1GE30_9GAMM|nr:hypothetical protein [Spongiibacter thalassae]NKI17444.1 hypothetical protein [Spongiibacter thalassae]
MGYTVESWNSVTLALRDGPFVVPADPTTVDLDFIDAVTYPPLPWASPSIWQAISAPLLKASDDDGATAMPLTRAEAADTSTRVEWGIAGASFADVAASFGKPSVQDVPLLLPWAGAFALAAPYQSPWGKPVNVDSQAAPLWEAATPKDRWGYSAAWVTSTSADQVQGAGWHTVNLLGEIYDDDALRDARLNTDTALAITLDFKEGSYKPPKATLIALELAYTPPIRPIVPHDVATHLTARQASPHDDQRRIPWGDGDTLWRNVNLPYPVEPNLPPPPAPGIPPEIKLVYQQMNTLQITDIATGTPLDIRDVTLSLDIDSLSWKFTGTVYGQGTLDLVKPDSQGMKEISVTINGHGWLFMIDRYTSDERFPTKKFQLSGLSRTQYMSAPFAPTRSYTNTSATTAAQAAAQELSNTGFTLNWPTSGDTALPDWPIPAGALSYRESSPAQVIAKIVTAAGGVMVPSRNADSWDIQPRYKTPPWQWASVTPDAIIYVGMLRSRSGQYEPGQQYDACYVSGINVGEAVDVHRAGSGGLNPMPDVYDDLITDAQAAISRGKAELSGAGSKVIETLSTIIPENAGAPGILTPGQIAKITHDDPADDYFGLVVSNHIAVQRAGAAEIYQSVTLERSA